mmetsp:Transcript_90070/g.259643  ORF Transcript_90070/g.259643 Transcript_90070/m.259643 type:complete len:246 (+) Transcript_90070:758-1495(+)
MERLRQELDEDGGGESPNHRVHRACAPVEGHCLYGEAPNEQRNRHEEDYVGEQHAGHLNAELGPALLPRAELEPQAVHDAVQLVLAIRQGEVPYVGPHCLPQLAVDPIAPCAGGRQCDAPRLSGMLGPLADILQSLHLRPHLVEVHSERQIHVVGHGLRACEFHPYGETPGARAVAKLAHVLPMIIPPCATDPERPALKLRPATHTASEKRKPPKPPTPPERHARTSSRCRQQRCRPRGPTGALA